MKFENMKEPEKEKICGIHSSRSERGLDIQWTYPLKYGKIVIFQVPKGEEFREEKAVKGEYPYAVYSSPISKAEYTKKTLADFYLFPCNSSEDTVYRQEETKQVFPIYVWYRVITGGTTEENSWKQLVKRFTKNREEKKERRKLKIWAEEDIAQGTISYAVKGISEGFLLPGDLKKEIPVVYELPQEDIVLSSQKKNIIIRKDTEGEE